MRDLPSCQSSGLLAVTPLTPLDQGNSDLQTMDSLRLPPLRFATSNCSTELNCVLPPITPPPRSSPVNTTPWLSSPRLPSHAILSPILLQDGSYPATTSIDNGPGSPVISPVSQTPSSISRPSVSNAHAMQPAMSALHQRGPFRINSEGHLPPVPRRNDPIPHCQAAWDTSGYIPTEQDNASKVDTVWEKPPSRFQETIVPQTTQQHMIITPPAGLSGGREGVFGAGSGHLVSSPLALDNMSSAQEAQLPVPALDIRPQGPVEVLHLTARSPLKKTIDTARGMRDVFACPYPNCARVSTEQSNMKAHMRMHTGEKPYVCRNPGCLKAFRWKSSLTYHEKALHVKARPFKCSPCRRSFVEKRKLKMHFDLCPVLRREKDQSGPMNRTGGSE